MVLGQGLGLVAAGVILGPAGALGVTRLMEGLLYGVSATDPLTLATMGGLLELSAALAIAIPVRRGSRVDPAVALRLRVVNPRRALRPRLLRSGFPELEPHVAGG